MAVYVDELQQSPRAKHRCFRDGFCHLTADSEDELHAFAARLWLRRSWFQPHRLMPHYDLSPRKRERALQLGAELMPARDQMKAKLIAQQVIEQARAEGKIK